MTNDELNKLIESLNMVNHLLDREEKLQEIIKILINHSKKIQERNFRYDSMDDHGFQFLHNDVTDKLKEMGIEI